ncbi:BirA family biotin operon repressor/biotin-[acetyl-CoA-carboxylase] ligase [Deinobacterium chartae]|uniref:Bifunctional ligase/repressor BirA n=1 Tax=Deinobacterium chartae TaxID=521158 RepID=A0A841I3F9_9DEIO|nr:BirA family biotin operon repressor/biotin-[acetyl-CoA-carboxylase] ligase [Deinobacterium chartae]
MSDLLSCLTEEYQSGEHLARQLGISRAAVWKAARSLSEGGYPIEVERGAGYRLRPGTPSAARLAALRRGRFGAAYRYLGTTSSTQDVLRQLAEAGAPEGTVVLAERQTSGRGRRGRAWVSAAGGLYFSVLLRPRLALADLALLPLAAGVALHAACGVGGLKWPNDLLAPDGRKLAGVLLEADLRGEELRHALLGIGVNVAAEGLPDTACGLETFGAVNRAALLAELLVQLEVWLYRPADEVRAAWSAASLTLGRQVSISTPQGEVRGMAHSLAPDGALLVRTPSGSLTRVGAGDVSLIGGTV